MARSRGRGWNEQVWRGAGVPTRHEPVPNRAVGESGALEHQPATRNNSASLRRALALLDYLGSAAVGPAGAAIAEIATGTGLNKSTALRLIAPLAEYRLVEQDQERKLWRLGPQTAYLYDFGRTVGFRLVGIERP